MWREEVGITEMMLAYIGEFAEFQGWSSWRTVVIDILTCHEEIRRQRCRPEAIEEHFNSKVETKENYTALSSEVEMERALMSTESVDCIKDDTSDRKIDLTTEVEVSDVKLEQFSFEYDTSDTKADETIDGASIYKTDAVVDHDGVIVRTRITKDESGIARHIDGCNESSIGERLPKQGLGDTDSGLQVQPMHGSTMKIVRSALDGPAFTSIEANLAVAPILSDSFDRQIRRSLPLQYRSVKVCNSNGNSTRCSFCFKVFKNVSNRRSHERIHTGEKPFPCSFCPKRFNNSSDRKRHEITHTSERPYVCSSCGQNFRCRSSKWRHERTRQCKIPRSLLV